MSRRCSACDFQSAGHDGVCDLCRAEGATHRLTNIELVTEMMEFSKYGPMAQVFIMEAITKLAEKVAASKPADYPPDMANFIAPELWIAVGQDIKRQIDERSAT